MWFPKENMVIGMPRIRALVGLNIEGCGTEAEDAAWLASTPAMTNTLRAAMNDAMTRWPMLSAMEKGRAMVIAKEEMRAARLPAKKQRKGLDVAVQAEDMTGTMMSATRMRKQMLAPRQDRRLTAVSTFLARGPRRMPTMCS